jgi:hypothetical protein
MKNVNFKKIALDLHELVKKDDFESFITEQIMTCKSSSKSAPLLSINSELSTFEVWEKNKKFILVENEDIVKEYSKQELMLELNKILENIVNEN